MKKMLKPVLLLVFLMGSLASFSACSWEIFEPPPHAEEETTDSVADDAGH